MLKRVLYCQQCGQSKLVEDRKLYPCESCHGLVFGQVRTVPWTPFDRGCQSNYDRKFLRTLRIARAGEEAQPKPGQPPLRTGQSKNQGID